MNFKKTYKSANDKLCADQMIIDRIFEKTHKKPKSIYVYRSVFAAMAAALIFVSIYAVNIKSNTNSMDNAVVYSKKTSDSEHADDTYKNTSAKSESYTKTTETDFANTPDIQKESAVTYDAASDSLPKEEIKAASSGAGISRTIMDTCEEGFADEYVTKKDYFDYLGFVFNEDAVLSNEMKIYYPESYRIAKDSYGNITEDSSAFTICSETRPEAAAVLTTGKINPPQISQDKCDMIEDTYVCVTQSGENLSADFAIGNSWCSLTCTGLNPEEFDILVSEIIVNKICQ